MTHRHANIHDHSQPFTDPGRRPGADQYRLKRHQGHQHQQRERRLRVDHGTAEHDGQLDAACRLDPSDLH